MSDDSAQASGAEASAPSLSYTHRVRGCLLGGALGDALGAPIEFLDLAAIRKRYGPRGLDHLAPGRVLDQKPGTITDDTQMTLFTAEGLIRAFVRGKSRGIGHPPAVVHHAYRRWLHTQGIPWIEAAQHPPGYVGPEPDGWLIRERFLFARRAPGHTCLSALEARGALGQTAANDSKGCGGVMRAAPVGLLPHAGTGSEATSVEAVFRLAVETAALTHGHPTGQLAAGVLAATIHLIVHAARPLGPALDAATRILRRQPRHEETLAALEAARALAGRSGEPTAERVESLGGGWIAEEALAIAVYAALVNQDASRAALGDQEASRAALGDQAASRATLGDQGASRAALVLAANHSGDSDSTAAICGNLLGALLGEDALPQDWLAELEGRQTIERLADDFAAEMTDTRPAEGSPDYAAWWGRYPGW